MKKLTHLLLGVLLVVPFVWGDEFPKKPDLNNLAKITILPEQMLSAGEISMYSNIIKAQREALDSKPLRKRLSELTTSFNNLVQTYSHEVACRLNDDEKQVLYEICEDAKELLTTIKNDVPRLNDKSLDPSVIAQMEAEYDAKFFDRYQQLLIKWLPFAIILQEKEPQQSEVNKQFEAFFTQLISNVNQFAVALKK